ncbi:MAG: hypothetical protein Q8P40_02850, partial [Nitrospirota bacterium]|nr:hypothetical protein [Nitrospirota bacterium]
EKKTLSRSGCLNFDFDALRSLPQGSSRKKKEGIYKMANVWVHAVIDLIAYGKPYFDLHKEKDKPHEILGSRHGKGGKVGKGTVLFLQTSQ